MTTRVVDKLADLPAWFKATSVGAQIVKKAETKNTAERKQLIEGLSRHNTTTEKEIERVMAEDRRLGDEVKEAQSSLVEAVARRAAAQAPVASPRRSGPARVLSDAHGKRLAGLPLGMAFRTDGAELPAIGEPDEGAVARVWSDQRRGVQGPGVRTPQVHLDVHPRDLGWCG